MWFQEITILPHPYHMKIIGNFKGEGGGASTRIFKGKYMFELNFQRGGEGFKKNLRGRGVWS